MMMIGSSVSYAFAGRIKEDSIQNIRKRETIGFNTDFKAGSSQNEPKRIPAGNLPVFVFSLYRKELGKFKREKERKQIPGKFLKFYRNSTAGILQGNDFFDTIKV